MKTVTMLLVHRVTATIVALVITSCFAPATVVAAGPKDDKGDTGAPRQQGRMGAGVVRLVDANGKFFGYVANPTDNFGDGPAYRFVAGRFVMYFPIIARSPGEGAALFNFESSDCSGTPLMDVPQNDLRARGIIMGTTLYITAASGIQRTINSQGVFDNTGVMTECLNDPVSGYPFSQVEAPPDSTHVGTFTLPFRYAE